MTEMELRERVRRLEVQVRALLCTVAVGAACALGSCAVQPNEVSAKAFILKDDSGRIRASLQSAAGEIGLVMNDRAGKPLVLLGLSDNEGATFITLKSPTRPNWQTQVMPEGISVSDDSGNRRVYGASGITDGKQPAR